MTTSFPTLGGQHGVVYCPYGLLDLFDVSVGRVLRHFRSTFGRIRFTARYRAFQRPYGIFEIAGRNLTAFQFAVRRPRLAISITQLRSLRQKPTSIGWGVPRWAGYRKMRNGRNGDLFNSRGVRSQIRTEET